MRVQCDEDGPEQKVNDSDFDCDSDCDSDNIDETSLVTTTN